MSTMVSSTREKCMAMGRLCGDVLVIAMRVRSREDSCTERTGRYIVSPKEMHLTDAGKRVLPMDGETRGLEMGMFFMGCIPETWCVYKQMSFARTFSCSDKI